MDSRCDTIRLYSQQTALVREVIARDGVCFSKAEYVRKKYGESAPVFLTAYRWFVDQAETIVPKPAGAEFPYWAFKDLYSMEGTGENPPLTLRVPVDEAVFFDMYDWNKIMQFRYIGENEQDERKFREELSMRGLKEDRIMLTGFYPEWKERIMKSWGRLFCHHDRIRQGDCSGVGSVQAGLWQIRREWIV